MPNLPKITPELIKTYLDEVSTRSSKATSKRKIASLKKFVSWAQKQELVKGIPLEKLFPAQEKEIAQVFKASKAFYSSFQERIIKLLDQKPRVQKIVHSLFYKRPNWYRTYHDVSITNYIHIALLIIFSTALGFGAYDQFIKRTSTPLAYPTSLTPPNKYLSFQGRLTDELGNPITVSTDLVFKLYDAASAGNTLWNAAATACAITPDSDGIFSTLLGSTCGGAIASTVFSENPNVWVGVKVGTDAEATPRIQIATVGYALNAETLQGYPPSATGTINTIPVINNSGDLIIGAASPTIQSTSGTFGIDGQAISIITGTGSAGNITIAPDGVGQLLFIGGTTTTDFTRITNANLTSGDLISGYVGNNTATGNLIALSSGTSETDRFTVSRTGQTYISGYLGIGTTAPSNELEVVGDIELTNLYDNDASNFFDGGCSATTSITGIDSTGAITCTAITGVPASSIAFSGITTGSNTQAVMTVGTGASLNYAGSGTINASSLIGATWAAPGAIGSSTPNTGAFTTLSANSTGDALTLSGTGANIAFSGAGLAQITTAASQHLALMPGGNVGIGTTGPGASLQVGGTGIWSSVYGFAAGGNPPLVYASAAFRTGNDYRIVDDGSFSINKSGGNPNFRIASGGNIAMGGNDTTPDASVEIVKNSTTDLLMVSSGATGDGDLFIIKNDGNVGIGTTAPSNELEVVGDIELTNLYDNDASNFFDGGCSATTSITGIDSTGAITCTAITGVPASSIAFSGITSGTNTQAAMWVGSGASLTYAGGTASDATINANQLLGGTWAIPGTIGSGTPNTGAFTTLSASTSLTTPLIIGSSSLALRPSANSTTAIQLQNAAGTSILNIDSTNSRVGIGTTSPTTKLHLAGTTSSDYAQVDTGLNFYQVTKPLTGLSAVVETVAGNVNTGVHYYSVTFVTSLGETSVMTPVGPYTFDTTTTGQATVTIPVSSDYRVTKRRIYRNAANASQYAQYLLVEVADNTTTTYIDNKADSQLGTVYSWYRPNTTNTMITVGGSPLLFGDNYLLTVGVNAGRVIKDNGGYISTLIGTTAGYNMTSGNFNTAIGYGTLTAVTTQTHNTAVGEMAGYNVTGNQNVLIGSYTASAIGLTAISGAGNTFVGKSSGYNATGAISNNVLVGTQTGYSLASSQNVLLGASSGFSLVSGASNIFIGYTSGYRQTTNSNRLIIDNQLRADAATEATNSIIYGVMATTPANQTLTINANVGIGTTAPSNELEVNGDIELTNLYDNDASNFFDGGCSATTTITGIDSTGAITCTDITGVPASSIAFSGITSGTNTQAVMVVGTGASLNYAGSGTINASSLIGGTWAIPGTIGSSTPNTGAFTTLSASTSLTTPTIIGSSSLVLKPSADATTAIQLQNAAGTSILNIDSTNGRVGIGTTSPEAKLQVDGSIYLNSGNTIWGRYQNSVSNYGDLTLRAGNVTSGKITGIKIHGTDDNAIVMDSLLFKTFNLDRMIINSSGKVGIGTTAPSNELEVVGDIELTNLYDNDASNFFDGGCSATTSITGIDSTGAITCTDITGVPASSIAFSGITSGTNTQAAMWVGSGASLTYAGGTATSGVINANQLLGGTWAIPGTIGSGTPNTGAFTTLTSSGNSTLGTGSSSTNTMGAGASSTNVIGSTTTPGTLTLHGATTLDNTLTVSGSNLTSLGGNLTVSGTAWTATPTISGLITATSGLTANGALTANAAFTLGDNGDLGAVNTSDWDISTGGALTGISGISNDGAYTQSGTTANTFTGTSTFSNATYSALFTGGNVGIGTTGPGAKLHVNGGIRIQSAPDTNKYQISGASDLLRWQFYNSGTESGSNAGSNLAFVAYNDAGDFLGTRMMIQRTGNIGIGTANPGTAGLAIMNGNVGIGTTAPSNELEVVGDIELTNLYDNDASNFFDGGCSATQTVSGIDSTGAISCTDVTGVPASSIAFSGITSGTNTQAAMWVGSGASLTYAGGTATSGVINANQLLGGTWAIPGAIGTTTPAAGNFSTIGVTTQGTGAFTTLSASGALAANGGITFDQTSDTIGSFTAGGTIFMNSNILQDIGNTGTDFVASTGALNLAGLLTMAANAGITLTSGTGQFTQTFTGTSTDASTLVANSLTSGDGLNISSTGTGVTGNLIDVTLSGSNANNTGSLLMLTNSGVNNTNTTFYIKHYATGTNNLAMRVDDVSGDTTPFVIDGAGNVGIGTTGPGANLQIGNGTGSPELRFYDGQGATSKIYGSAGSPAGLKIGSTGSIHFEPGNNRKFYMSTNGKMGINNIDAGINILRVLADNNSDGTAAIRAENTQAPSGGTVYGIYSTATSNQTNIAGYFSASGGSTNYGLIVDAGNVGIGTTAPSNELEVVGDIELTNLYDNDASNFFDGGCSATQTVSGIDSTGAISCTDVTGVPASSIAFSGITTGSNTQAVMVVGTGASLNYAGSGTINASSLIGNTWAIPGAIGTTTPAAGNFSTIGVTTQGTGSFTTLSANSTGDALTLSGTGANIAFSGAGLAQITTAASQHLALMPGGNVGIGTTGPGAKLQIDTVTDVKGLIVKGMATQTANLQEWQNSAGTTMLSVSPSGGLVLTASAGANTYPLFISGTNSSTLASSSKYNIYSNTAWSNGTTSSQSPSIISIKTIPELSGTHNTTGQLRFIGLDASPNIKSAITAVGATSYMAGISTLPTFTGTGTFPTIYGVYAGYAENNASAVITNGYGMYVQNPNKTSGTITNNYGLYLESQSAGGTLNYAIYTNAGSNLFNAGGDANTDFQVNASGVAGALFVDGTQGNVGIGTTGPAALLSVGASSQFQVNSSGIIAAIDGVAHTIDDVAGDLTLTSNSAAVVVADDLKISGDDLYMATNTANYFLMADGTNYNPTSPADARTGLGLAAGGTGDIWVEKAGDTMTGNLTFSGSQSIIGGTATTADLTLQTTSGVGEAGADMHFKVGNNGATEAMTILNSGNVGIGTTNPLAKLEISGGDLKLGSNNILGSEGTVRINLGDTTTLSNTTLTLNGSSTLTASSLATFTTSSALALGGATSLTFTADNATIYGSDVASGNLTLEGTSNATKTTSYVILQPTSGNVGIGTTAPSQILHTYKDINGAGYVFSGENPNTGTSAYAALEIKASDSSLYLFAIPSNFTAAATADSVQLYTGNALHLDIRQGTATGDIRFKMGTADKMIIDNGGNVGIGTTAPGAALDIGGNLRLVNTANAQITAPNGYLDLRPTHATYGLILRDHTGATTAYSGIRTIDDGTSDRMEFAVGPDAYGTSLVLIAGSGDVSIGTIQPGAKLNIKANYEQLRLTYTDGSVYSMFTVDSVGDLTIQPSGGDVVITGALTTNGNAAFYPTSTQGFKTVSSATTGYWNIYSSSAITQTGIVYGSAILMTSLTTNNASNVIGLHISDPADDTAGSIATAINIAGINWDTDINLQNAESIDNNTNGVINLQTGATAGYGIQIDAGDTATVNGLCHSGTNSATTFLDRMIVACSGAPTDIAEFYPGEQNAEPGDVVTLIKDTNIGYRAVKSTKAYDQNVLGVVSTIPTGPNGDVMGETTIPDSEYPQAIGLLGRVAVKVSLENGPILVNDWLTTSSTPGIAMKATKYSRVFGRALEAYDGSIQVSTGTRSQEYYRKRFQITVNKEPTDPPAGIGKIVVMTNPTWHDPDVYLTDTGDLNIQINANATNTTNNKYQLTNKETVVDRIGAFAEIIAANIRAGAIETKEIAAGSLTAFTATIDNLLITNGLVSPVVQTDLISPIAGKTDVTVQVGKDNGDGTSGFGELIIKDATGSAVASISSEGDATFSGELHANKIYAGEIVSEKLTDTLTNQSISIEKIEALLKQVEHDQNLLAQASTWNTGVATESATISSLIAGQLAVGDLFVTNQAAMNSLSLLDSLAIGSDMVIQGVASGSLFNTINTLSKPLSLQSLALAPVEIMAGKIKIQTNGDVEIQGNLYVAGKIEAQSLAIKTDGQEFASINASGSAVFDSVSTDKLVIAGSEATTSSSLLSGIVTETNATAGKGLIPAGVKEITIKNPKITDNTLVYVTPTSETQNNVLFVKSKEAGKFVVGFTNPLSADVTFNWWIIELEAKSSN